MMTMVASTVVTKTKNTFPLKFVTYMFTLFIHVKVVWSNKAEQDWFPLTVEQHDMIPNEGW